MNQRGDITTAVSRETATAWLRRWDVQQERYMADREERFTVICDVAEAALHDIAAPVVIDLGCGPGSLSARLHRRIPAATVIGIDSDPLLLALARAHYGDPIEWVDADLAGRSWPDSVPGTIHAAVSTTALHWLSPAQLAELYRTVAALMAPGGVFINGDHLGVGDDRLNALARTVRDSRAARMGVQDNEDWGAWWEAILADPEFAGLAQVRADRIAGRACDQNRTTTDADAADIDTHSHHGNGLSVGEHSDLLRSAGFSSVAPVWQSGDDHVLVAFR